jgi:hypothetical protein
MRRTFTESRALDLLARADLLLAAGALRPKVCRELGISYVLYERLRRKYPGRGGNRFGR